MCASPAPSPAPQRPGRVADTPLWLSHHRPDQFDRCVVLGGRHVCRRCVVLYPLAAATMIALLALDVTIGPALVAAVWLLPVPTVVEWVLEHAGRIRHSPARQVALTVVAAPALGIALAAHARQPFTTGTTAPLAIAAAICLVSAWWATRTAPAAADWETRHEADELARQQRLGELIGLPPHERPAPSEQSADR